MLSGEVAKFFEPSVEAIAKAFAKQQKETSIPIKVIPSPYMDESLTQIQHSTHS